MLNVEMPWELEPSQMSWVEEEKIYDDVSKTINECKKVINSLTIISDFVERRTKRKKISSHFLFAAANVCSLRLWEKMV
jgi:hypothetical protein